jgi:hypothetical protein
MLIQQVSERNPSSDIASKGEDYSLTFKKGINVPTPFLLGSQSTKGLGENPIFRKRLKQIDIKYH